MKNEEDFCEKRFLEKYRIKKARLAGLIRKESRMYKARLSSLMEKQGLQLRQ